MTRVRPKPDRLGRPRILHYRARDRHASGSGYCDCRGRSLGHDADGPDKPGELTTDGRDDVWRWFTACEEATIAATQTMLRLPRNLDDRLRLSALSGPQGAGALGGKAIRPRGLDEDAAHMRVAGFGDRAPLDTGAARMLARHGAAVAHELARMGEARQRADLTDDRRGADLANTAQTLQRADDGAERLGSSGNRRIERLLEPAHARGAMIDFLQIITQGRIQSWQLELQRVEPAPVRLGPGLRPRRRPNPVPQQKLAHAMTRAELIGLGRFPGPDEIPQGLVCGIGHPHRREIACSVTARELLGVPAVGLDAIPGLRRHERGRDDGAGHAQFGELPVEHVAARPGFVARAELLAHPEFANHFCDGGRIIGDHPQAPDLPAWLGDRDRDAFSLNIQTQVPHLPPHSPAPRM